MGMKAPWRGAAQRGRFALPGGGGAALFPEASELEHDDGAEDPDNLQREEFSRGGLVPRGEGGGDVEKAVQVIPQPRAGPAQDSVGVRY